MFSSECGNNCVKVRDAYALVRNSLSSENTHDNTLIVYERLSRVTDFFTYPLDPSKLGIHLVDRLAGYYEVATVAEVTCKYVMLPHNNKFVIVPLLHQKLGLLAKLTLTCSFVVNLNYTET